MNVWNSNECRLCLVEPEHCENCISHLGPRFLNRTLDNFNIDINDEYSTDLPCSTSCPCSALNLPGFLLLSSLRSSPLPSSPLHCTPLPLPILALKVKSSRIEPYDSELWNLDLQGPLDRTPRWTLNASIFMLLTVFLYPESK